MAINVIKIINLWVLMIRMKKFFVELIGTFFLVFTIGVSGNVWAIATVLMAMIYMGGYISGAHYNPAVTVGFIMRGTITVKEGLVYWIAQFSGALIGGLLSIWITGTPKSIGITEGMLAQAIVLELLFTSAMMLVILNVATSPKSKGNQYYGLAISSVVLAGMLTAGPISGAAFNPAVSIGHNIFDLAGHGLDIAVHLATSLAGAALGALGYKLIND